MRNPLQTTITHAEPVFDSFSAALGRALRAIGHAVDASGMIPRGKARATYAAAHTTGHAYPLVVMSCVAGGPDLPDPDDTCRHTVGPVPKLDGEVLVCTEPVDHEGDHGDGSAWWVDERPDLEADGYSWGPNARDLLYRGLTPPDTTETPC